MTTPVVVTWRPAYGVAVPVPWSWAMVIRSAGVGCGSGSGVGSPPVAAALVGVTWSVTVKSALLSSVSTPFVRVRDFGSELAEGAPAAAVSKVFVAP
ncbi:hypothetical protein L597_002300000230 [Micrococcus luteus J28]|nr:hypothetical protein L597_002300000230 [Micrococcus luteus J28]